MGEALRLFDLMRRCDLPFRPHNVNGEPLVSFVTENSRDVSEGALFCCLHGQDNDGHDLAAEALAAGAAALLTERPLAVEAPQAVVANTRAALGPLALAMEGNPQNDLLLIGVTGTNGKTTTVHLLASILNAGGNPTQALGTLTGDYTTPPPATLAGLLADALKEGANAVAMEVSSHALEQRRVEGLRFAVGIFTNLSPDHLDYHNGMEDYFAAKRRLFEAGRSATAVICRDDEWGLRLAEERRRNVRCYSLNDAEILSSEISSTRFRWRGEEIRMPLGGLLNVSNAIAAGEAALALGMTIDSVKAGLAAAVAPPGRFQLIAREPFGVIVDYAHTPHSLEMLLRSARDILPDGGRLLLVFGCGGERYEGKRAEMGRVAAELADDLFVTSDNPRSEDPEKIAADILAGVRKATARPGSSVLVELERRSAFARAFESAPAGSLVLLVGKGHEARQEIGGTSLPFSDREVALDLLGAGAR